MQTASQEHITQSKAQAQPKAFVPPVPVVQKKLKIGESDDPYEAEADAVADKVVHQMDTPPIPPTNTGGPLVQKKCSNCEDEELRRKPLSETITPLAQRKALASQDSRVASPEVTQQINNSRGAGNAMDGNTQSFMEDRFGSDFSDVRIHTDNNATQLSKSLNAQAFTVGNDIYFNEGKYNPGTTQGKHLLAHELTHTIQQGGAISKKINKKSGKRIQRNILDDIGSAIGSAAETTWDYTGGAAIRFGGRVIEWAEDRAEEIIEDIAPGLLDFLRNGWDSLKEMLAKSLDRMTGGLFSQLQAEGLSGILEEFVSSIIDSLSGKIADACTAFAQLARKIFNFIEKLTGRALQRIRAIFNKISAGLSWLWTEVGKPVVEAVKSVARDVWDWVVEKANWVWDLIKPIRDAVARAWEWIKDAFNIAWNTGKSVLDWLTEKLEDAWNWIVSAIEPIKKPLMVIGSILLLLSPLGPFVLIGAAAYGIYRAVIWVKDNWDNEVFVKFREMIKENILDPIASGINQLQNLAVQAFNWLSGAFERLKQQVMQLMESLGILTLFQTIKNALRRFGQAISDGIDKVKNKLSEIYAQVSQVVSDIWNEIRPYVIIAAKLFYLALNPWLWPIVLSAWFWRALPDCFKPAIVDFVIKVMILVLRSMPNFKNFGETWFQVKTQMIEFLQDLLKKSDEEKITASNRVAKMVSELDLEIISNQVEALIAMPGEIEGQMEEELLGMDLTKPLPFEIGSQVASLATQFESLGLGDQVGEDDAALFSKQTYGDNDIGVDSVGEFAPSAALIADIQSRTGDDGVLEFGNAADADSRTVHSELSDIISHTGGTHISNFTGGDAAGGGDAGADPGPDPMADLSPEEQTELRLQHMMAQSEESMANQACDPPKQMGQNEGAQSFPEHAKFGPLTRGQRARYTLNQMWSGMKHWWKCNRHWLIPTLIGIIVVLVVAEVLSGGWVTAAIPVIFEALIPLMIGVAAIRSAYYIGEYVYKSIKGDINGAAKSLARSLAVVAVELIFALLGSSAFWRSVKTGAAGAVNFARGAGKAISRVAPRLGRAGSMAMQGARRVGGAVMTSGRAMIQRGRLVMRGVSGRIGQGVRTLEELAEGLFRRVRFRRFRIRFQRGWFRLEGYINPWVLLATGNVREIDDATMQAARGNSKTTLGREVMVDGQRGVIIGATDDASRLTQHLQNNAARGGRALDENREIFEGIMSGRLTGSTAVYARAVDTIIDNSRAATRLIQGRVPREQIQRIVMNALSHPGADVPTILSRLQRVQRFNINTFNRLLSELSHPMRNKYIGGEFVLAFLSRQSNEFIAGVRGFEVVQRSRRIDVLINGLEYEFKNWGDFTNAQGLVNQMVNDFVPGVGLLNSRYVIASRAGSTTDLIAALTTRINNTFTNPADAQRAISQLNQVILRF
ncbi:DUF4157 domain-containing protein [Aureisphaera galaxeae]|uniref:eCIS core domain-containing protein n=1 Tax=Aureisphaera galaxeae TaxID=1538023 RepID=UPI0023507D68|nr:DUF4157 domain-containing protein [Aureisphaera galaxeae]MDC8005370.1 DUF4157 domain-containing protein [Aureisphaera galaxeae]